MNTFEVDVQLSFAAPDGAFDEVTIKKITQRFTFQYTDETTIDELFDKAQEVCGYSPIRDDGIWPFKLYVNGNRLEKNGWIPLKNFVKCFCPNNLVELNFICGIGGEVARKNGIIYRFHSDEKCAHSQHIHAFYQGEDISIDLQTFETIGKFKNPVKMKEALKFVKKNQRLLQKRYKAETNGISVGEFASMKEEPGSIVDKLVF